MPTDILERLAKLKAEFNRQTEEWERARRALAQLSDQPVQVPVEFFERLEALAQPPIDPRPRAAIRG